jgi:hypothetical protein
MFKKFVRVENIVVGNIIMYSFRNYYEIVKIELYNHYTAYNRLYLKLIYSPSSSYNPVSVVNHDRNTELLLVADNIYQIRWISV